MAPPPPTPPAPSPQPPDPLRGHLEATRSLAEVGAFRATAGTGGSTAIPAAASAGSDSVPRFKGFWRNSRFWFDLGRRMSSCSSSAWRGAAAMTEVGRVGHGECWGFPGQSAVHMYICMFDFGSQLRIVLRLIFTGSKGLLGRMVNKTCTHLHGNCPGAGHKDVQHKSGQPWQLRHHNPASWMRLRDVVRRFLRSMSTFRPSSTIRLSHHEHGADAHFNILRIAGTPATS